MRTVSCIVWLGVLCGGCGASSSAPSTPAVRAPAVVPGAATELVLVTTPDWTSPVGTIALYTRGAATEPWQPVGATTGAVVGRSGLGWGAGLHGVGAPSGREGPIKHEGDGRAPAGVFALADAFGYAEAPPQGTRIAYHRSSASWVCVDDGASAHYNTVLDTEGMEPSWTSAEHLLREDPLYERLVVVRHNVSPPVAGNGSCIFLHVWRFPDRGTDGCYATSLERVEEVMRTLHEAAAVLVALPEAERTALTDAWELPPS